MLNKNLLLKAHGAGHETVTKAAKITYGLAIGRTVSFYLLKFELLLHAITVERTKEASYRKSLNLVFADTQIRLADIRLHLGM